MGLKLPLLYSSQKPQRSIRNSTVSDASLVRLRAFQVIVFSAKQKRPHKRRDLTFDAHCGGRDHHQRAQSNKVSMPSSLSLSRSPSLSL